MTLALSYPNNSAINFLRGNKITWEMGLGVAEIQIQSKIYVFEYGTLIKPEAEGYHIFIDNFGLFSEDYAGLMPSADLIEILNTQEEKDEIFFRSGDYKLKYRHTFHISQKAFIEDKLSEEFEKCARENPTRFCIFSRNYLGTHFCSDWISIGR